MGPRHWEVCRGGASHGPPGTHGYQEEDDQDGGQAGAGREGGLGRPAGVQEARKGPEPGHGGPGAPQLPRARGSSRWRRHDHPVGGVPRLQQGRPERPLLREVRSVCQQQAHVLERRRAVLPLLAGAGTEVVHLRWCQLPRSEGRTAPRVGIQGGPPAPMPGERLDGGLGRHMARAGAPGHFPVRLPPQTAVGGSPCAEVDHHGAVPRLHHEGVEHTVQPPPGRGNPGAAELLGRVGHLLRVLAA
mmetsp:Transcript_139895/g.389907  ORF Transcript_139895/g.389907 Transcript_139895/m.389907 type:complete len:245 (-) Transcript_139895:1201-1935(-)